MLDSRVVALVDDDQAVLDSLKFLLETAGYTIAAYSSAAAFLADRMTQPMRPPACLIVDQHMPMMTGLELVARLRDAAHDVPALLITGMPSPAIEARANDLGIQVLEKPPGEVDVLKFIDAHL